MNIDEKKLSVIAAAVSAYLAESESAETAQNRHPDKNAKWWRMQGIVAMMDMRRQMQLRTFKSNR